jgi:hypothetical protein
MTQLIDCELTDRVWNLSAGETCINHWHRDEKAKDKGLLEQNGNETSVEIAHAAFTQKAGKTGD